MKCRSTFTVNILVMYTIVSLWCLLAMIAAYQSMARIESFISVNEQFMQ